MISLFSIIMEKKKKKKKVEMAKRTDTPATYMCVPDPLNDQHVDISNYDSLSPKVDQLIQNFAPLQITIG